MIAFPRGNTHLVQVAVTFDDPVNGTTGPMDLSGAQCTLFVKSHDTGTPILTIPGQVYGTPTDGKVRFPFVPGDTLNLTGRYRFCIDVQRPSLDVFTVARDDIEFLPH